MNRSVPKNKSLFSAVVFLAMAILVITLVPIDRAEAQTLYCTPTLASGIGSGKCTPGGVGVACETGAHEGDACVTKTGALEKSLKEKAAGFFASAGLYIVAELAEILQHFLAWLSVIAANFLDAMLETNVNFVVTTHAAIGTGWLIIRNLINSLFILILLWIAFTIIFDFESLGGKRLLTRVIVVALLINFSLAMVGAVFGFTNALAKPFSDNLPRTTDPVTGVKTLNTGGFIEQALNLQAIYNKTPESFAAAAGGATNAALGGAAIGCVAAFFIPVINLGALALCGGGAAIGALAAAKARIAMGPENATFDRAVNLLTINFMLILLITAFLYAAIALLLRLVAIIIISVTAPAAFMLHIIPGNYGEEYWNKWLNALLRWSFFAPIFYLLLYLTMLMLQSYGTILAGSSSKLHPLLDTNRFAALIVILTFMIASVHVAKKGGGAVAGIIMGYAKRAAGFTAGVVTGGALIGAQKAAQPAARWIATSEGRVARTLRSIPGVGAGAANLAAQRKLAVEEQAKKLSNLDENTLSKIASASLSSTERDAAILNLAQRGKLKTEGEFSVNSDKINRALKSLESNGVDVKSVYKIMPNLAPPEKRKDIIYAMSPDEKAKISKEALADTGVRNILASSWRPQDIQRAARVNPEMLDVMKGHIDELSKNEPEMNKFIQNLRPETYKFISSDPGRVFGLTLPEKHQKPASIITEERAAAGAMAERLRAERTSLEQEISQQEFRIESLKTKGPRVEKERLLAETKLEELKRKLASM